MRLSVIIPTHNPNPERLRRTLAGLSEQTLPGTEFEVIIVDNASSEPLTLDAPAKVPNFRIVREMLLGLTPARLRGIAESRGEGVIFVDDDNVLSPDYLAKVVAHFASDPSVGALGGRVIPEFEQTPPAWTKSFHGLLALRDHGGNPLRADWRGSAPRNYPEFAPIGAGIAVRRALLLDYAAALRKDERRRRLDRTGIQLVSGGDNDLVMHVLESGSSVGYEPDLSLTHLIPPSRTERKYLGALNRAVARSWVGVLALHNIYPWPPVTPSTVPLRQGRSWWHTRAWRNDAAWVTWQGRCGIFEGQADLYRHKKNRA